MNAQTNTQAEHASCCGALGGQCEWPLRCEQAGSCIYRAGPSPAPANWRQLLGEPAPSQPAQVGEWVQEAERLVNALMVDYLEWINCKFASESTAAAAKAKARNSRASLDAHLRTRPAEDAALLKMALEALKGLANTFHEGRALPDKPASEGYVQSAVDAAEASIAAIEARLGAIVAGEEVR